MFSVMPSALAEDEDAKKLVKEAEVAYNLRHFQEALAGYESAYKLDPVPELLFNIAQCHRLLRHYGDAAFFYKRYLSGSPRARNTKTARKLLQEVERLTATTPERPPSEAAVPPPPPPPLAPAVVETAAPSPSHMTAPRVSPPPAASDSQSAVVENPVVAEERSRQVGLRPLAFGLIGGGVVAGGVGGAVGWASNTERSQINGATTNTQGVITGITRQRALELASHSERNAVIANTLFGAAASLAIAGIVLFIAGK
jgi:hypothetical protein